MVGIVCFILGIIFGIPCGMGLTAYLVAKDLVNKGEIVFNAGGIEWIVKENR